MAGWPNGPSGHSSFAKGRPVSVVSGMQLRWFYLPAALLSVILCSCKSTGGGGGGPGAITGPFDSRGNYVEAWADTPSKWRKGGSSAEIADAQPDREAANVPVVPEPVTPPPTLAANERPKPISTTTTRVYKKPDGTVVQVKPKSGSTAGTNSKSKSKPVVVKPKTTPKKEIAKSSKTKPKAKPKSSAYTVKSGDNLNSIAKRHGTTASAVQRANGLKSVNSIIRPGQKLTIPK